MFCAESSEACAPAAADAPAHDAPGVGVYDKGHVDKAGPGGEIVEVRHPQSVGRRRLEPAVHPVKRARRCLVASCGLHRLAPDRAGQTHLAHQSLHRAARHVEAFAPQLAPDLAHAVDREVLFEHAPHLHLQGFIALGPRRPSVRIAAPSGVRAVGGRSDRQHPADRLDAVHLTMIVDEGDHGLNRRSSSA